MTSPVNGALPAGFYSPKISFTATNTTIAKVLVDTSTASVATSTSPLYYGGCSVISMTASTTDTTSTQYLNLWSGTVMTTVGGSTGTTTTTTSTIVRSSGSFITDGWRVGDLAMLFTTSDTAPNAAVDGILTVITAVAALTLTVNGTPIAALTVATGTRVCKVVPMFKANIPASSGTSGTSANVSLVGNSMDASSLQTEVKLAANELIAVSESATISAVPVYTSVVAQVARY